ncbi:MAG TPA: alpha/beta hydrolase [Steroidobacteraceae bacterium]|nr:alpha/beta hydrolase [Steroidobacteraceae bacterium]
MPDPKTLAAALLAAVTCSVPAAAAAEATLALTPCRVEHPLKLTAIAAECGTLSVAENPARPGGRRIALYVARVPAINRRKQPDPLFILAGGPGMAATDFYAGVAAAFARIGRDRDIVLVDQRGTGRSNTLTCELDQDAMLRASPEAIAAETARCLDALATRADVAFYTTSLAVQDLDRVRAALGYERVSLYGVSYGSRVAQHYVRRFPGRVRAVILDGVVPPQLILGPAMALDAEHALESILRRCARDASCRGRFGDPALAYRNLRAQLQAKPVPVSLQHPTTGEPWTLSFTGMHLATVLRLASYASEQAALLPLALHAADRDHNFAPLAAQFAMVSDSLENVLAYGMNASVVCAEDVPFYDSITIDRAQLERTYLGTLQLDALRLICRTWPRGPMDEDLHAPLESAVPALLLSGTDDPVTPPSYAEQARHGFGDHHHLVLRDQGHGQLGAPCVDRVMAAFIAAGTARGLDVSCTRAVKPMPFFTSLAGPAP